MSGFPAAPGQTKIGDRRNSLPATDMTATCLARRWEGPEWVEGWWVTCVHAFGRGLLVPDESLLDFLQGAMGREPFPLPACPPPAFADTSESYYEEAQPYGEPFHGKDPEVSLVPSQLTHAGILSS